MPHSQNLLGDPGLDIALDPGAPIRSAQVVGGVLILGRAGAPALRVPLTGFAAADDVISSGVYNPATDAIDLSTTGGATISIPLMQRGFMRRSVAP